MSFEHASVTKGMSKRAGCDDCLTELCVPGLMFGFALSSIAAGIFDLKHYLNLQLVPHISRHHQVGAKRVVLRYLMRTQGPFVV